MSSFAANTDELSNAAQQLQSIAHTLDNIQATTSSIGKHISTNESLEKLGYENMVFEVSSAVDSQGQRITTLAQKLHKVSALYQQYEAKVIAAPIIKDVQPGQNLAGGTTGTQPIL